MLLIEENEKTSCAIVKLLDEYLEKLMIYKQFKD
jgi:hypothetical protein